MSSVDDLLSALRADGAGEGVGEFSLDPEKAREKLRSFQEALPSFALLRMVQGLHQAGTSRIELKLGRQEVELRAFGLERSLEEVQAAFAGGAGLATGWAGSVAAGLNAACLDEGAEMEVSLGRLRWEPRGGQSWEQEASGFLFSCRNSGSKGLKGVWTRATIQREIVARCRFSPCPFELDGRVLEADWEAYKDDEGTPVLIAPQIEVLEEGEGFRFGLGDLSPYRREGETLIWDLAKPRPLEKYRSGFFPTLIYSGLGPQDVEFKNCRTVIARFDGTRNSPALFHLIRHGVVGEIFPDPEGLPNSMIAIDMSEVPHDLSGLRAIRAEAFERRMNEVQELSAQAARLAIEHTYPALLDHLKSAIPSHLTRTNSWFGRSMRTMTSKFFGWLGGMRPPEAYVEQLNQGLIDWLEEH